MPATTFLCVDKQTIPITDCLTQCRLTAELPGGRCLSVRTLRAIAEQRPWTGKPSTTQLLKGTREAYLEIVTDYTIDPQDQLFRLVGTRAHSLQEQFTTANEFTEERLHTAISSGQIDFYDPQTQTLYDTKTSGSYKIMKALGYHQVQVSDGVYKTNCKGGKKGDPKFKKEWRDGGRCDRMDWAVQLNDYRMKLEEVLPRPYAVKHMVIECIARDGGTFNASRTGIEQRGVLIEINRISDRWIDRYMKAKSKALLTALETGVMPAKCRSRETWQGRKCDGYCNVSKVCKTEQSKVYVAKLEEYLEKEAG